MYTTADRRSKPRIDCDCQAIVNGYDINGNGFSDSAQLVNLSAGGLFMLVNREVDCGTKLDVTVLLTDPSFDSDAPKLATNGIVVRKEPHSDGTCGVAIKFNHYRFL